MKSFNLWAIICAYFLQAVNYEKNVSTKHFKKKQNSWL
jgi:hypothetical protein